MLSNIYRTSLVSLALGLLTTACTQSNPIVPSRQNPPLLSTYQSVWINASWIGGRTGPPLDSRSEVPPEASKAGRLCAPSTLLLENHGTRFLDLLGSVVRNSFVVYNNCSITQELVLCVSAGSGGGGGKIPVCNQVARTTPLSRLYPVSLAPGNNGIRSATWENTSANLDINLFYCAEGTVFTAGLISGANATDCLK